VLAFFGISLPALRIAGGIIVALFGWGLLSAPKHEAPAQANAPARRDGGDDIAFYPLTLPVSTGPGTIAVAVALSGGRPSNGVSLAAFMIGLTAAGAAAAISVWIACRSADWLAGLLGPAGSRIVTRLSAFLLLCIGVQILITGVTEMLAPLLSG